MQANNPSTSLPIERFFLDILTFFFSLYMKDLHFFSSLHFSLQSDQDFAICVDVFLYTYFVHAFVIVGVVVELALWQVILHPVAPVPCFLALLMNFTTIVEFESNWIFFLFPQTLRKRNWLEKVINYNGQILRFITIFTRNGQGVSFAAVLLVVDDVDFVAVESDLSTGLIHQVVDSTVEIGWILGANSLLSNKILKNYNTLRQTWQKSCICRFFHYW